MFDGLFLQSGSFFCPRFDDHERQFRYYPRMVRFVAGVLDRAAQDSTAQHQDRPVPVVLTCGAIEENVDNNRLMAQALRARGYPVALHELPDMHNYTAWRDAFDPHLTRLLRPGVRMNREAAELWSGAIGAAGTVIRYGHWGRPALVFPTEGGQAADFENNGMVGAVAGLIDAGRLKLYCVDSYDAASWSDQGIPLEERARRHGRYESWILSDVLPWIHRDCGGPVEVITLGCSMGAFHAANFALKRADLFPAGHCAFPATTTRRPGTAGVNAAPSRVLQQPPRLRRATSHGDHLDWLRAHVSLLLVCGQGQWEDTTGALRSTRQFAALLAAKGIKHEARPVGIRRPARLAVLAGPAGPPHAAILLTTGAPIDRDQAHDRVAARHRRGLACGVRGDLAPAGPGPGRRRQPPHLRLRADHHRAVRAARPAPLPPGHRPARVLVLRAAGMAEEGRADGRRVPAE